MLTITHTANTIARMKQPAAPQLINGRSIITVRHKITGERFAVITPSRGRAFQVPRDICSLAAGEDAWMRTITFPCDGCKVRAQVGDMQNGYCATCSQEAEEENARQDAGE